ncbi:hypothetical protein [Neorhizobium tunisiense]|uniref:hypothetical protein n=1 Tax=Neorhizobium tunisiense TaxID=3144793 RepID=UPI0031F7023E
MNGLFIWRSEFEVFQASSGPKATMKASSAKARTTAPNTNKASIFGRFSRDTDGSYARHDRQKTTAPLKRP